MADCDVGEIFLNFMLEPKIRPYDGVDLTKVFSKEALDRRGKFNGWWSRILIGFSPSSYFVTKDMFIVEKLVRGDRLGAKNVFCW